MRQGIEVQGLRQAQNRIDRVGDRAQRPLPGQVASAIRRELERSEARRFRSGAGWRRLTPRWVEYKRAHGFDARKLVMTGSLEKALTQGGGDSTFTASHMAVEFGLKATAKYKAIAKYRRPVMVDRSSRTEIAQIVQRYVAGGRK
jgi:hypothetical protein